MASAERDRLASVQPAMSIVASTIATNGIRTCLLFGLDLKAVPADPKIEYDRKTSTFYFIYMQKGPNGMAVTCHALLGQLQWVCA